MLSAHERTMPAAHSVNTTRLLPGTFAACRMANLNLVAAAVLTAGAQAVLLFEFVTW
jgi:hypothetical protein